MKNLKPENILFALLLFMASALLILRISLATSYLAETGGVSVNVLYGIQRIINGNNLYTAPELAPFPIIQYMPLHYYLIKGLSFITGAGNSVHNVMVLNRMVCLIFDILTTLLLAITFIRSFKIKPVLAWILAFIYFNSIPGIIYGRVDNLYLLLTLIVFVLIIRLKLNEENGNVNSPFQWLLPGFITGLALATKQTALFMFIFNVLFLLISEKSSKKFFIYSITAILTLLTVLFVLSPGEIILFKLNVVDGVKNGFNLGWFIEVLLKNYFLKHSYLIALGLLAGVLMLRKAFNKLNLFLGAGIIWWFVIATITSFKGGSGPNYFLEFLLLSLLAIANICRKTDILQERKMMLYALIILPFFIAAAANDKGWGDIKYFKKSKQDYADCTEVASFLNTKLLPDEYVLTAFHKENSLNLMLNDKALFPCREVALYFTRPLGVFHFRKFGEMVQNGQVAYLVYPENKPPESFIDIPLTGFKEIKQIGRYKIYSRK